MKEEHSFYNRFFQDYVETPVLNSNGKKTGIIRTYVGDYYRQDVSPKMRILIKVTQALLFALGVVFFFHAADRPVFTNVLIYVYVPMAISGILLIFLAIGLLFYLFSKTDKTIGEYREASGSVCRFSLATAISLAATAVAAAVSALFIIKIPSEIITAGEFLLSAVFIISMRLLEQKIPYTKIPSENKPPEGENLKI